MRKLWVCSETVWGQYSEMRSGIRIWFEKGVSEEVRQACIRFIRWLRAEYCFSVRVHLYFKKMRSERGRDNALAAVLHSIVHELSHYFQWLKNRNEWEMADKKTMNAQEWQVVYYAREIVMDYAEIVEHP